ncbi:MAG: putative histidine kinase, hybrid [Acidimicrobiales bacterium]|nr:putative histidine kinase, hybrid [Acidimicrobiales bacterium]
MPYRYMASSLPPHQIAELHRLMNEEIREVAVFFLDPQGIITVWNRAAEEMKGYPADEAIGQPLAMLYTDEDQARGWPAHNLTKAEQEGFYKEETWRKRKDGSLFWARIALTALREPDGQLVGFSKVTMDLTDHKRLEQCVKERQESARILRAANAGTWTWRPENNRVEVSESFLGLMGEAAKGTTTAITLEDWLKFVHPHDRPGAAEQFKEARSKGAGTPLTMELRMCRDPDNCRWFQVHAEWLDDSADQLLLSGVSVDIDDMKSAVEKLREADRRKDEFLAMLAHELRNPLAPIRTAAEMLKTAHLDEARIRRMSEIIARQVDHMTGLVNDLLDVSRVTTGRVDLDEEVLDVRQILADAVEQVRPLLRSRHHQFKLNLAADSATVLGDYKRLVQVFANLLNNAAKYTPEGGQIELESRLQDAHVHITITDNGIGIEPGLLGHVFELFAQAERTPDRSSGGLGLGLALVRSLVELHHGTVQCSSEGLGKGSKFTVLLPLHSTPGDKVPVPQIELETPPENPLRILVVDDNVDAAQMLAMLLEASGHEVMVEYAAYAALERARIEAPDVCVLDIGLPEMDGNQLAQRLQNQPQTADSVLIALTGYGEESNRKKAMASGFSHYLVKPVEPGQLLSLLATVRP